MLKSLFSAFLMYSRIPLPGVEWKEENRRYALGFFPLVGAVTGGALLLWRLLCTRAGFGQLLFAAGALLINVIITGGIHLDGFCDVTDARASWAEKEKRLEIMSDPHIGSFAVIRVCLLLIVQTALFSEVTETETAAVIASGYVLSRALSGLSAVTFRAAKSSGSLQSFVKPSHKRTVTGMAVFFTALPVAVSVIVFPAAGIASAAAAGAVLLYHRYASYRDFGGITGDLCGWFLVVCETAVLAAAVLTERIASL